MFNVSGATGIELGVELDSALVLFNSFYDFLSITDYPNSLLEPLTG